MDRPVPPASLPRVFDPFYDFETAIQQTAERGYYFASYVVTGAACVALEAEAAQLEFTANTEAVNPDTKRQVTQSHERAYLSVGDPAIPMATLAARALAGRVQALKTEYPELAGWHPTEAGYQCYTGPNDGISPHRDRASDQLLAVTLTVKGTSGVNIYESAGAADDYSSLRQIDKFRTNRGSLMMLRASGLGNGERVIHEALPPERRSGSRLVLNLRMRDDILE